MDIFTTLFANVVSFVQGIGSFAHYITEPIFLGAEIFGVPVGVTLPAFITVFLGAGFVTLLILILVKIFKPL